MNAEIYAALIGLALVIIGSIMAVIKAWTNHVLADLEKNTLLTREARDLSNGRLGDALRALANERDRSQALRELVRERDNRIAFLQSRLPGADALMKEYGRRHEDRVTPTRENTLLQKLIDTTEDCPTGSDAGRFRPP